jgi:hypothetical protein
VYNTDKTGVRAVKAVHKIISAKRKKQVRSETSSERGTLVTVCVAVNATGKSVSFAATLPWSTYSTLEAICSSETSVDFQWTIRRYIQENTTL